jgi:hypothetical protein
MAIHCRAVKNSLRGTSEKNEAKNMASLLFLGQNLRSKTIYDLEKDILRKG